MKSRIARMAVIICLVLSVIAGAQSAAQVRQSALAAAQLIPAGLWAALKAEGLIRRDAPVG